MLYKLELIEYQYEDSFELPGTVGLIKQAIYDEIPPLVSYFDLIYRKLGLALQKVYFRNFLHKQLGQVARIDIETLPAGWMPEDATEETLTLCPKTLELKYFTPSITPLLRQHHYPIATVMPTGLLQPFIPSRQQDAIGDFCRALEEYPHFNESLMLIMGGLTLNSMHKSTTEICRNNRSASLPLYTTRIRDKNIGEITTQLIPCSI